VGGFVRAQAGEDGNKGTALVTAPRVHAIDKRAKLDKQELELDQLKSSRCIGTILLYILYSIEKSMTPWLLFTDDTVGDSLRSIMAYQLITSWAS
jgi:hypothetical protein